MAPPPIGSNLAELDLADRARAGDALALAELYRRHSGGLHRHAARMLRDEAAAKDVVQEAFVRAITSMAQTRAELHFRAWVFRIATNLCLRELTQRSRTADERVAERQPAEVETASADRGALRQERLRAVEEALAALPDRQRQILLLREVEELSYEELGEVLELSLGNVKVSLHRARARFAAELFARQLLANGSALEGATCEVGRALSTASRIRELVRHLESCERCRTRVGASLPELLALSPPLPLAPPPAWPLLPGSSSEAGTSSASSSGTGSASAVAGGVGAVTGGLATGWVIAFTAGALLLAGVATVALTRASGARKQSIATGAPRSPRPPQATVAAGEQEAARESREPSSSRARLEPRRRQEQNLRRRAKTSAVSSTKKNVPQLGDTEDAP